MTCNASVYHYVVLGIICAALLSPNIKYDLSLRMLLELEFSNCKKIQSHNSLNHV